MSDWLILVEHAGDLAQHETPHKVMRIRDYIVNAQLFTGRRPNIINLARSYSYQSKGYYASLLAEARGHRIVPTAQSVVELSRKGLYAQALPDLNVALMKDLGGVPSEDKHLLVSFGNCRNKALAKFSKLLFDWFRSPVLDVTLDSSGMEIKQIKAVSPHSLKDADRAFFLECLSNYTRRQWVAPKERTAARWALAILVDPKEEFPPSSKSSVQRFASVAAKMGVEVDLIGPNDLASLAEYDALFIRTTTAIDNFTYRFARRAEQEGMPVIDDTRSMIRCTNKVFLKELMEQGGVPAPKTEILDATTPMTGLFDRLGSTVVLKAPDGSFSRQVHKVTNEAELASRAKELFADTALIIAQEFMPTDYDWRIGVLDGEPLFACKYKMARGHWQIIKHEADGKYKEGGFETLAIKDAPPEVIEIARKAAQLIGNGLYGIDMKQNERGIFVIEINDNPNLETEVEGAVLKDELWRAIIGWFSTRLERRMNAVKPGRAAVKAEG